MAKYTYSNSFHNTEVSTRRSPEELEAVLYRLYSGKASDAERQLQRRMRAVLCGVTGCTCGDDFGRRA